MNKPAPSEHKKLKILVVDDEEVIRKLLFVNLKNNYSIELAIDGLDALEKIKTFKPDLFIVDGMMPKMDGFGLVKKLRENPDFQNSPIIMLTARGGINDKVVGFNTGVDDYITKPFNLTELNLRIDSFLKKSQKTKYVNTLMTTIGNASEDDIDLLGHDLKTAASIQLNMMPSKFPAHDNFSFGAKMVPAKTVGGDFYDFVPLGPDRVAVCVGDVSGKGITAALLMVMVRTIVRVLLAERMPLVGICNRINSMLIRDVGMGKFITMFIAVLNIETGEIESYVNAGHLPPLVVKSGGAAVELASTGPFLGAFPEVEIESATYKFDPGDLLAIYTDGIPEAEQNSQYFGDDRLMKLLIDHYQVDAQSVVDAIVAEVGAFSHNKSDDVTIVVMKYAGSEPK